MFHTTQITLNRARGKLLALNKQMKKVFQHYFSVEQVRRLVADCTNDGLNLESMLFCRSFGFQTTITATQITLKSVEVQSSIKNAKALQSAVSLSICIVLHASFVKSQAGRH